MAQGKRTLPPYVLVNAQSMGVSFNSSPISIERFDRAFLEIICTGTMTGTITVQGSVDYVPPTNYLSPSVSPANWHDIPLGLNALVGVDQTYVIDFQETSIGWIRISYTQTGGTGSMTAVITAKES